MFTIDVGIPNYNHGMYLRQCVLSVLRQEVTGLRILIIDNASTDNSLEIANELAAADSRVRVIAHQSNLGFNRSINELIDWASSKYFLYVCADDLVPEGWLAQVLPVMERNPDVVLAHGRTIPFAGEAPPILDGRSPPYASWKIMSGSQFISQECATLQGRLNANFNIVRTLALKQIGRVYVQKREDYEMMIRIASLGAIAETGMPHGYWRRHDVTMNDTMALIERMVSLLEVYQTFFDREGRTMPQAERLHKTACRSVAAIAYWAAVARFVSGNFAESANLFKFTFGASNSLAMMPPLDFLFQRVKDRLTRVRAT